ncbi:hypothetical protein INR49_005289 [Caranx melampygus]|nr:hypothetical protein INR49_005289 [Caranx melampygus]
MNLSSVCSTLVKPRAGRKEGRDYCSVARFPLQPHQVFKSAQERGQAGWKQSGTGDFQHSDKPLC